MTPLPTLSGENVILRPWRDEDASDLHREIQDPEIVRWLNIPLLYSMDDAASFIGRTLSEWRARRAAHFVIADRAARLRGYVAALALSEGLDAVEIVYWVAREARGRGVALDALKTLISWLEDAIQPTTIELGLVDGNPASAKVAEACGFVLREILEDAGSLDGEPAAEWIYEWPS